VSRVRRLPFLIVAVSALVIVLAGCSAIKPGSVSLSQPAEIGPVQLNATFCTILPNVEATTCGAPGGTEPVQAQHLLVLVIPIGTTAPATIATTPSPGATPTSFTRNQQVAAAFAAGASPEKPLPPPGFELAGYISGEVTEAPTRADEWALSAGLTLPLGAGGGSYGMPFKTAVLAGWREVTGSQPASRPVSCLTEKSVEEEKEPAPGIAICSTVAEAGNEPTLGVSDLKIKPPAKPTAVPGAKVKLPFVLDFATSAAALPTFKLTASSKLPGAKVSVSSNSFSRGASDPATNRAPATKRQAIVEVPATAKLGSYEVLFTATAKQGGVVTAAATLAIVPSGQPQVKVAKKVGATLASGRGIPVNLVSPIAGSRFVLTFKGPKPSGKGKVRLVKKVWTAKEAGPGSVRMRIPAAKAQAILAAGAPLSLEAKVSVPGTKKPKKLIRTLKLR
jgi:hypothetical protein